MREIEFGKRLVECREAAGIGKKEMARLMNYPYRTLDNYEKGQFPECPLMALRKFSERYNVSLDYLVNGTQNSIESEVLMQKINKKLSPQSKEALARFIDTL